MIGGKDTRHASPAERSRLVSPFVSIVTGNKSSALFRASKVEGSKTTTACAPADSAYTRLWLDKKIDNYLCMIIRMNKIDEHYK